MNYEALKQEAIRKAWIAEIGEEKFLQLTEQEQLYANGFIRNWAKSYILKGCTENLELKSFDGTTFYRPKSLQGIEDNNGWIRIEADGSNLPDVLDHDSIFETGFLSENEKFTPMTDRIHGLGVYQQFSDRLITHFAPMILRKQPIV